MAISVLRSPRRPYGAPRDDGVLNGYQFLKVGELKKFFKPFFIAEDNLIRFDVD